jgi:hypothetical protein
MPGRVKVTEFVGWNQKHITGDEKGHAQIFRERFFQAFGYPRVRDETFERECETNRRFTSAMAVAFACN